MTIKFKGVYYIDTPLRIGFTEDAVYIQNKDIYETQKVTDVAKLESSVSYAIFMEYGYINLDLKD